MSFGFVRVCCVSPSLKVADCAFNAEKIIEKARIASKKGASIIVFPELSITGCTCADLFLQKKLQDEAIQSLELIASKTRTFDSLVLVGLPVCVENLLYDCAAVIHKGKVLALIPKTFFSTRDGLFQARYFSFAAASSLKTVKVSEKIGSVPFGKEILIRVSSTDSFVLSVELGEDLASPFSPSIKASLAGANVIANLAASEENAGKSERRKELVKIHSLRTVSAYLYSNAGSGESSQDSVFSSHSMIFESGTELAEIAPFSKNEMIYADVDVERIMQERRRNQAFFNGDVSVDLSGFRTIEVCMKETRISFNALQRKVLSLPFIPDEKKKRDARCEEIFAIQAEALARRIRQLNPSSFVIGLSGGLDSALSLLVTCRALDLCSLPRSQIICISMPCFGTTERTKNNALRLASSCGVTYKEIPIAEAVLQHFRDIGHDENIQDITYENAQARERTQVLMDIANKSGGIVIGTGDLSELALGWCTYNADHMSMYGVNASVPKTLVREIVRWLSENAENPELSSVLEDILSTPVSPELIPPKDGKIFQQTESIVGPYELHDFYLYHVVRFGFSPEKILFLSDASDLPYSHAEKLKWLKVFYKRFFSQQFKRNCMPDGAKVGSISLSARGDWKMPSDASAALWLSELERLS